VPNPDCNSDPCSQITCPTGQGCVNMGAGIQSGPICVPIKPCDPNPCTDLKTVCVAEIDVVTTANAAGVSTLTDAKPFKCVPVPDPAPTKCDPNPCFNGGICTDGACKCQNGFSGRFCGDLDCLACSLADTKQCRTANAVLSSDGTTTSQFCVCNDARISGAGCGVVSSPDGTVSPVTTVPTRDTTVKASVTGTLGTSFNLQGGRLDPTDIRWKGDTIVVNIDRLDANGVVTPGPLPKGSFAWITLCSSAFVSTQPPQLFLVEPTELKNNDAVCADVNAGATVPAKTFDATGNCWTFPVCHASTYGSGTLAPVGANGAATVGVSLVTLALGLVVL